MLATSKPLTAVTAAEVMSRDLVTIPQYMSLRTAAWLLSQACVSGGPVVDNQGTCVGVLSANDFMRWAHRDEPKPNHPPECTCCDWQILEFHDLPVAAVSGYMSADPVTAPATATVHELARKMIDAHIHRVVIVDEQDRPIGIVSSTDIIAAVARLDPDE